MPWTIQAPWFDNVIYKSPDLSVQLQEIVDRAGFIEGNNVMVMLEHLWDTSIPNYWYYVSSALSAYNAWSIGPYQNPNQDRAWPSHAWTRFANCTIPQGATITSCVFRLYQYTVDQDVDSDIRLSFYRGDNALDIATADAEEATTRAAENNTDIRTDGVTWNVTTPWVQGNYYNTPDLTTELQEIVDRPGWQSGNDLAVFSHSLYTPDMWPNNLEGFDKRRWTGFEAASGNKFRLAVTWTTGSGNFYVELTEAQWSAQFFSWRWKLYDPSSVEAQRFWSAIEYRLGIERACLRAHWRAAERIQTPRIDPQEEFQLDDFFCSISTYPTDADIYYTTNGSDPNENDTLYTVPFEITFDTTVKAKAYKQYWIPSFVATKDYETLFVSCDLPKPTTVWPHNSFLIANNGYNGCFGLGLEITDDGTAHLFYKKPQGSHLYHMYGPADGSSWSSEVMIYTDPTDASCFVHKVNTAHEGNNVYISFLKYDASPSFHNQKAIWMKWSGSSWSSPEDWRPLYFSAPNWGIAVDSAGVTYIPCRITPYYGYVRRSAGGSYSFVQVHNDFSTNMYQMQVVGSDLYIAYDRGLTAAQNDIYSDEGGSWAFKESITWPEGLYQSSGRFSNMDWFRSNGTHLALLGSPYAISGALSYREITPADNISGSWNVWDKINCGVTGERLSGTSQGTDLSQSGVLYQVQTYVEYPSPYEYFFWVTRGTRTGGFTSYIVDAPPSDYVRDYSVVGRVNPATGKFSFISGEANGTIGSGTDYDVLYRVET